MVEITILILLSHSQVLVVDLVNNRFLRQVSRTVPYPVPAVPFLSFFKEGETQH